MCCVFKWSVPKNTFTQKLYTKSVKYSHKCVMSKKPIYDFHEKSAQNCHAYFMRDNSEICASFTQILPDLKAFWHVTKQPCTIYVKYNFSTHTKNLYLFFIESSHLLHIIHSSPLILKQQNATTWYWFHSTGVGNSPGCN